MIGLNVHSQLDSLEVSNLIIGKWKYDYSTHFKSETQLIDTFYIQEVNRSMYLYLTSTTVEEISINNEEPNVKLNISEGKGDYKIFFSSGRSQLLAQFNCEGFILCGNWEITSINKNQLVLKDYFELNDGKYIINTIYFVK